MADKNEIMTALRELKEKRLLSSEAGGVDETLCRCLF